MAATSINWFVNDDLYKFFNCEVQSIELGQMEKLERCSAHFQDYKKNTKIYF
jgi:hypothetical protein